MVFPTLFQLAAKSVAQHIHNDNYQIDFNLDTISSNAVVRELLELDPKNIGKLKTHKNQLSTLTELDLRNCEIDVEGILNLKNFKLNSLELGELYHLRTEFPDPTNSSRIDIVSLLDRATNNDSQEHMVHLGFYNNEEFISGWEEKISKLLPSLQSIKIKYIELNERFQFSNLCNSFPNLCVLDISYAEDLETLEGIKNLKNLQKLVMHNALTEDVAGYKELSELKNLRVLDVSEKHFFGVIKVIRNLLAADVRMENLEFLDCSMAMVEAHELKEFVERHPSLKTVVAIFTSCDNSHIPNINLLNFLSTDSTLKSLEYAITNDREDLAEVCILAVTERLNTNHSQLNDSEICRFLNALCYVLREVKDVETKYRAIACFAESSFFQTERFFFSFSLEIPGIVELIFKSWEHLKCSETIISTVPLILTVFKRIVDFLRCGRILQDRLMYFIIEKTVDLSFHYPENLRKVISILIQGNRFMSLEQSTAMCNNKKVIKALFEYAHYLITIDPSSYQQIMGIIVSHLNQASESTLKYLVSNCQAVEKCYEQIMLISYSPSTDS
ncbi:hypothetical protein B9Z55_004936 [Caenorhabditis nigoni]|uniref:Zer-1-like leucine-rich repeats region domain-containing protein n=1 Tax=Caenorhabditis nigoni TaxID=1611254 RepID=A0A2G5UYR9_9PELO|nr:hypothetical protein B9Z55_004936 [Caenorhabditis nigoni]